jgi:hypothetical protein
LQLQDFNAEVSDPADGSSMIREILLTCWGRVLKICFNAGPNSTNEEKLRDNTMIWIYSLPIMYDKKHSVQQHAFLCHLVEQYPDTFFSERSVSDSAVVLQRLVSIYNSDYSDEELNQRILTILSHLKKSSLWSAALSSSRTALSELAPKKLAELQQILN